MSTHEISLALQGLLGKRDHNGRSSRKFPRKIEGKQLKNPETLAVVHEYHQSLRNLIAFNKNQPLPNCPRCSSRMFLEIEIREEARLVCQTGHSTEVVRVSASKVWVRVDFFEKVF